MLQRKNKGSILIMTLITFSIISLLCITCSSLILSNNRIYELEYKTEQLKEINLGVIELIKSNIIEEVNYAIKISKTKDEFYNYLAENNHKNFINKVKDINKSNLKNILIEVVYNSELSTKEFLHYKISVKSKIDNYEKYTLVKVKIKNPLEEKTEEVSQKESETEKEEVKEEYSKDDIEINEYDLITFYNYEEK